MTNKAIDLDDMNSVPVMSMLNDIYRFMGIPISERKTHRRRKGLSILEPATLEAYKHWDFTWAIMNGDLKKDMKVLDCGSGRGIFQFYLSSLGLNVHSNDISDASSKIFRKIEKLGLVGKLSPTRVHDKLNRKYKTDVKFHFESSEKLSFEDNSFDRVFSVSVIEHMPDDVIVKSVQEMERVLKPGGRLLLTFDYHQEEDSNAIGFRSTDFMEKVVASFKQCSILGNQPDFNIPDWGKYLSEVNGFFQNENPNTSYGVVFTK